VPSPERRLALETLIALEERGGTLGDLLAAPKVERLAPRERGFLHELVLGTLRHRGGLDFALAAAMDRPLARVDPPAREALRLGAYQVLKLRVADHAAVSETVDLARSVAPRAAGFVNAVLRRLTRDGAPAAPDLSVDPLGWLTTEGSLPPWLAERWLKQLGAETAVRRAKALLEPAPSTYRLNPRRADAAARVQAAALEPRALPLEGAWEATAGRATTLARDGTIYLQDMGSQLVAHLAAAGGRVLDACAAPGGKSLLMADLHPDARVAALEISPRRLAALATLARRWGAENVHAVGADALSPPFAAATFDSVLLDAPCSGLGTIGRNPDIRWRLTPGAIAVQAERQRRMIARAALLVKPGGRLVYSTCTLEPEETDEVVAGFLDARRDFTLTELPTLARPFADGRVVRLRPEANRADGFFAAVLTRVNLPVSP
jgi:16S rRNA (cytosine967-C5)-methyltransferase